MTDDRCSGCEYYQDKIVELRKEFDKVRHRSRVLESAILDIWLLTRSENHQATVQAIVKICKRVQE